MLVGECGGVSLPSPIEYLPDLCHFHLAERFERIFRAVSFRGELGILRLIDVDCFISLRRAIVLLLVPVILIRLFRLIVSELSCEHALCHGTEQFLSRLGIHIVTELFQRRLKKVAAAPG